MKKLFTTVLLIGVLTSLMAQQAKLSEKIIASVHSTTENLDRTIFIQLPNDYGKVNKHYPLIVLFDAQDRTLYDCASSAIDRLTWTNDIPEAIFVGVVQNDRSKELNFEKNETSSLQFLNFIKDDLLNYLSKTYALNGYYTLIGHSLGGQFVTNAMLTYPATFKSVISISGALNYPNQDNVVKSNILSKIEDYAATTPDSSFAKNKYYFSTGDGGFQDSGFKLGALKVDSSFKQHKSKSKNWHFDFLKGFNHMTTPLVSIPTGLIFIFNDWHLSDSLAMDVLLFHKSDPLAMLQTKKTDIFGSYGIDMVLPYHVFYQFADYYLSQGNLKGAEILAKQIIDLYPNNDESYSLMAEVLIKKRDLKNAIKYLEKAQSKSSVDKYAEKIKKLKE
ncbi:MAG: alpha/beta hydrolase-fold protein [Bacteroidota bacterium]